MNTRRSTPPYAVRGAQRFRHVVQQLPQPLVELLHRAAHLVQHRILVGQDLSRRHRLAPFCRSPSQHGYRVDIREQPHAPKGGVRVKSLQQRTLIYGVIMLGVIIAIVIASNMSNPLRVNPLLGMFF